MILIRKIGFHLRKSVVNFAKRMIQSKDITEHTLHENFGSRKRNSTIGKHFILRERLTLGSWNNAYLKISSKNGVMETPHAEHNKLMQPSQKVN